LKGSFGRKTPTSLVEWLDRRPRAEISIGIGYAFLPTVGHFRRTNEAIDSVVENRVLKMTARMLPSSQSKRTKPPVVVFLLFASLNTFGPGILLSHRGGRSKQREGDRPVQTKALAGSWSHGIIIIKNALSMGSTFAAVVAALGIRATQWHARHQRRSY
jgi:hypothetical protein